jgi:hypothetical protein
MILAVSEFTYVSTILKLMVFALTANLSSLPMTFICVIVLVLDAAFPVLEILFPATYIDAMRNSLFFFSCLTAFLEIDLYIIK